MTAVDPRVGEIEARLNAATPGPWAFDGTEIDTVPDPDGDSPWKSVMECRVDCMSYCYGGSVAMDIGSYDRALIEAAPADLAYLLAELRKRDEALAAVAVLHEPIEALMFSGPHERLVKVCAGCGTDDGNWQRWPCPTIAAVTGDGA